MRDQTHADLTNLKILHNLLHLRYCRTIFAFILLQAEIFESLLFSEPQGTASYVGGAGYWNETEYYWTAADVNWDGTAVNQVITDSNDSNDKIQYLILGGGQFGDGDTITIQSNVGASQTTTITLNKLQCGKFEKIRVIFYNKYGALQDIWVDKKVSNRCKLEIRNTKQTF